MRILITGAAGNVGSAAVEHFVGAGEEVVATDALHRPGLPVPLRLADLKDEIAVYGLMEGVDAVVHLGNHPNSNRPISRQRLLTENVQMTANVFWAAVGTGVRRVVYASSIQAMMDLPATQPWGQPAPPCPFPRLPADGGLPARTGVNPYGMSKAHGEHLLRELCGATEGLAGVALRLPFVRPPDWPDPVPRHWREFRSDIRPLSEALASLHAYDACRLFEAAVRRAPPGYRCYFPASCMAVAGVGPERIARDFLPHVPVTGDVRGPGGLVDLGPLEAELGWVPREPTPLLFPPAAG